VLSRQRKPASESPSTLEDIKMICEDLFSRTSAYIDLLHGGGKLDSLDQKKYNQALLGK
jgi:hypothetical protein